MFLNILQPRTFISHRYFPSQFHKTVLKVIDEYQNLVRIEKKWSSIVADYCQSNFQSEARIFGQVSNRKVFHQLINCFKVAESRLKTFPFIEDYMDCGQHKDYLECLAVAEICGNLILSPTKIDLKAKTADNCNCCTLFQITPNSTFSSNWARDAIQSIEIGHQVQFVWGWYNASERRFIPPTPHQPRPNVF